MAQIVHALRVTDVSPTGQTATGVTRPMSGEIAAERRRMAEDAIAFAEHMLGRRASAAGRPPPLRT